MAIQKYTSLFFVQGGKHIMVNARDLVKLLMRHSKMSSLLDAAGDTHVEVNSGSAAVIARAVQAATNPTEGQRMLQASFDGTILGGESRDKTSTTINADGIKRVDRVVERSAISENGQEILVQQVQQMATNAEHAAQMSNIVTKAELNDEIKRLENALVSTTTMVIDGMDTRTTAMTKGLTACTTTMTDGMAACTTTMTDGMAACTTMMTDGMAVMADTLARHNKQLRVMDAKNLENEAIMKDLESKNLDYEATMKDLESKTDKRINIIKKKMRAQNEEHDTKEAERDAKEAERDAKDAERDKLIASLQRDRSKEEKRPADNQGEGTSQKKSYNALSKKNNPHWPDNIYKTISKKTGSNGFMWRRNLNKVTHKETGFKTIEEALKNMAQYFENLAPQDTAANDQD